MTARLRRVMSPPIGSILSTSAPWSARNIVAYGPETTPVRSSTRTPFRGPAIGSFPQFESPFAFHGTPRHSSHAQIRSSDIFICDQRLRVAGELNPSLTEDVDVISQLGGEVIVLLDKQDRNPRSFDVHENGFELLNDHRRQTLAGFIENHQIGPSHQRPPDGQHLLLAARKLAAETSAPLREPGKYFEHMFNRLAPGPMLRRAISDR